MAKREYFIGETIKADGDYYNIIGKITFRNKADGKTWDEYRLRSIQYPAEERWLAVDEFYNEYSLSRINPQADTLGYHSVDRGIEQVIAVSGDVGDVEVGDTASFEEFEDQEEELIVSIENWDDGPEYSSGYYLDPWEFGKDGENTTAQRMKSGKASGIIIFGIIWAAMMIIPMITSLFKTTKTIEKYLKKSTDFQYVTSITGSDKKKANVYEYTAVDVILTYNGENKTQQLNDIAKNIVFGIDGDTDSIQQNNEEDDSTVAILTNTEYCIVYLGEDNKIYVQVSSREYAYTSDKQPYHSRQRTHRYYRRFYYSRGYSVDSNRYSSRQSSYSGYSDGTVDYDSNNSLNTYSGTVRQDSINSRSSSGGGLSSGK